MSERSLSPKLSNEMRWPMGSVPEALARHILAHDCDRLGVSES